MRARRHMEDPRDPSRRSPHGPADGPAPASERGPDDPFLRAENEDDDGYDPYSDRGPAPEALFEPDPWE